MVLYSKLELKAQSARILIIFGFGIKPFITIMHILCDTLKLNKHCARVHIRLWLYKGFYRDNYSIK